MTENQPDGGEVPQQRDTPEHEAPARRALPGAGLVQGLATTLKTMVSHAHTRQYPDVAPELPPRSRGVIALIEENCTSCMLCARECPDWCIYIDSHKETIPAPNPGGRERSRNVLDRFAIDFSLCMWCGICIEVCPFDALEWSPEFEYAEYDIRDLLHEKERLGQWVESIPPPVALDDAAEEPKEVALAQRAAAKRQTALDALAQAEADQAARRSPEPPAPPAPGDEGEEGDAGGVR